LFDQWAGDYVYSIGSGINPANNKIEFAQQGRVRRFVQDDSTLSRWVD
jgi:hypothetical protein